MAAARRTTTKRLPVQRFCVTLSDGRRVAFFVDTETHLIVVDVIDRDERGGREVLRTVAA